MDAGKWGGKLCGNGVLTRIDGVVGGGDLIRGEILALHLERWAVVIHVRYSLLWTILVHAHLVATGVVLRMWAPAPPSRREIVRFVEILRRAVILESVRLTAGTSRNMSRRQLRFVNCCCSQK